MCWACAVGLKKANVYEHKWTDVTCMPYVYCTLYMYTYRYIGVGELEAPLTWSGNTLKMQSIALEFHEFLSNEYELKSCRRDRIYEFQRKSIRLSLNSYSDTSADQKTYAFILKNKVSWKKLHTSQWILTKVIKKSSTPYKYNGFLIFVDSAKH